MSDNRLPYYQRRMLNKPADSRTFGVNVLSHFWLIQAFLPGMIAAGRGHIVSVASLLGITGNAQLSKCHGYCE